MRTRKSIPQIIQGVLFLFFLFLSIVLAAAIIPVALVKGLAEIPIMAIIIDIIAIAIVIIIAIINK